ncbi:tryptophan-rich sensory protein [Patescibacteria group bacterium]|nr:tryptophan-rich sensory protein [Patescibacteria group bacterium]
MKINHLLIPYLALLIVIFGSVITGGGVAWYQTLALPVWHPSETLIGAIWIAIYIGAAWSLLVVWNTMPRDARFKWIMGGFTLSTLINLVWSVVFFHLHVLPAAVWCAVVLGISMLGLIALIFPKSKKAALLLLPYTVWVFYAAYLNYTVYLLNA